MAATTGYHLAAMGVVCALGRTREEVWARTLAGDQAGVLWRDDLIPGRLVGVAAVTGELPAVPPALEACRSRNVQLSVLALAQIEREVAAAVGQHGAHRVAVVMGSSTSGVDCGEAYVAARLRGEYPRHFHYVQHELGTVARAVATLAGATGPAYTVSTACASSAKVLAAARNLLELGLADAVIVGGADTLCGLTVRGFAALEALAPGYSNPFSQHRAGITLGEGAAIFLLTRGLGGVRLLGVGEASDAHHMNAPEPSGRGALAAMTAALADAGLPPAAIAYLNLHGTGTPLNNAMESRAVAALLPHQPWCSSTKPLHGHTLGAAGAIEAALCWLWLRQPGPTLPLPPQRWDGIADPALPPLHLAGLGDALARPAGPLVCMSNSFAFGGSNCAVVLGLEAADHGA